MTPTTTVASTVNAASVGPGPTATQSGIASNCNNYGEAMAGDDCFDFATAHNITPAQLYQWNAVLGPNGQNCSLQFQSLEYYCIGTAGTATSPPTTSTTSSASTVSVPSPTQSGIDPSCNKYAEPAAGQGCYDFATANNITPDQLYQWNKILGAAGANCGTQFQAGENYCVGVSGGVTSSPSSTPTKTTSTPATTTASSTAANAPSPTQIGIVASCVDYAQPASGQGCYDFATAHGIQPAQLYQWNTVLGASGANCGTAFLAGEWYCIGVTVPSSTQSGLSAKCYSYDLPQSGQGCYDFATAHNITPAQLYTWNPVLGSGGANCGTQFQAGEYYCVGANT